ncbi:peptidase S16, lon domain-containing protein [Mycolicibacterium canariasense]|uniref:Peptidase S16, lon domain-containing protein n=1 Tax=Mycolicibacterium canariasense TaxID=228230 RepID=A0A100WGJ0_MYCCR|nr:LON peptidase substrate-binding domain-containing protein [Mycolicibacterium canariasense]MCV7209737.1 LON peptidase substrate-binding domain-containing protein [Mycolicibacterium canariasense]GAS97750.1 peptidase S16, lon domain-containing protein [Mycolicibacterium canariasense]
MTVTPMFPLEVAMLPGEQLPLRIFEPRYSAMIADCLASDRAFGVVLIAAGREVGGGDARNDVGALARIAEVSEQGGGRYRLRAEMAERLRVTQWLSDDPYPRAEVAPWPDEPGNPVTGSDITDVEDAVLDVFSRVAEAKQQELPSREELLGSVEPGQDAGERLYALAARLPIGQADRYAVLAAPSASDRLAVLTESVETLRAMVEFQLAE